jgi:hypothetical protein
MTRREFVLVRTVAARRVADLSCERLYMRFLDAQVGGPFTPDDAIESEGESERAPRMDAGSTARLFAGLAEALREADVVRLTDRAWLASEEFGSDLERVLAAFRARGGVVQNG